MAHLQGTGRWEFFTETLYRRGLSVFAVNLLLLTVGGSGGTASNSIQEREEYKEPQASQACIRALQQSVSIWKIQMQKRASYSCPTRVAGKTSAQWGSSAGLRMPR